MSENNLGYVDYKVIYNDGRDIEVNDLLKFNHTVRVKVLVKYKDDDASILDLTDVTGKPFSFTLNYVQSDNNAISKNNDRIILNNGEIADYISYTLKQDTDSNGTISISDLITYNNNDYVVYFGSSATYLSSSCDVKPVLIIQK